LPEASKEPVQKNQKNID